MDIVRIDVFDSVLGFTLDVEVDIGLDLGLPK
jgi:hypothetical protein